MVSRPPVVQPGTGNNIIINPNQRLNPVLECIRNVGKEFGDVLCDFQVGRTTGVLFLSLKYHRLHPEYIHQRIEKLGHSYNLRILLVLCDISEHQEPIRDLTKICLINNITVLVAWSTEGAGHYLFTFKQYEHKPPDMIKERTDKDYSSVLHTALTSISRVNKTDVETLRTSFRSFADIAKATPSQLQNLPGFGQVKVKRTKEAFENPFRNNATTSIVSSSQIQTRGSAQGHDRSGTRSTTPDFTAPKAKATAGRLNQIQAGPSRPPNRPPREPSPVWDIELDLDPPPREVDDDTQVNRSPLRAERTDEATRKRAPSRTASSDSDDLYADD